MGATPKSISKYEVIEKLAEGGMGAVYKAKHPTLNRIVIIKKLTLKGSAAIAERFKREARIMIDLTNDHIAQVYDHFKEGSAYYLVMEYVEGIDLEKLISQRRYLSNEAAMLLISEICKGLEYAHAQGVVHRDIKPANILISNKGEVKITDFGISVSKEDQDQNLTMAGTAMGTPAYMSPEQISDSKNVDNRADIYSLGVMLYEMVTGKLPYPPGFTPEIITLITSGKYTPPEKINPKISSLLRKIIKKSIYRTAAKRIKDVGYIIAALSRPLKKYHSQEVINDAIAKIIRGEDLAELEIKKAKKAKYQTWFFSSLRATPILLAFLLLVGGIGGGGFYVYQTGIYLEYTNPAEYGALRVVATIPKNDKELEDIFVRASLYYQGKDKQYSKQVRNINLEFIADQQKEGGKFFSMTSQKVFLKSDKYLVSVNLENEKYYQNFFLWPKIEQKRNLETKDARVLAVNLNKVPITLPLKVDFSVRNRLDKANITNSCDFFVRYTKRGNWLKWNDFVEKDRERSKKLITTGRRYRFKITKDGFQTKYHSVYVRPYQTILKLNVEMEPVSGNLFMKSNYAGLNIMLNNSSYYSTGGNNIKFKKLNPLTLKTSKTILPSGTYFLTIKKESFFSNGISKTKKITITPRKNTFINATYSEKDNTVDFDVKE